MRLRQNVLTALLAAALCVMAPVALPLGPVPVTLATLGVYLAVGFLGPWRATAAVGLYLLLGAVGVPVFAGFVGGFPVLFGATGGYLWGYLPGALLAGCLCRWGRPRLLPLWLVCGGAVIYAVGTLWYMVQTDVGLGGALLVCVAPHLLGEGIKIAVAVGLILPLRKRVNRLLAVGVKEQRL